MWPTSKENAVDAANFANAIGVYCRVCSSSYSLVLKQMADHGWDHSNITDMNRMTDEY